MCARLQTSDLSTFKFGVGDRGSSIRIPLPVSQAGALTASVTRFFQRLVLVTRTSLSFLVDVSLNKEFRSR